LSFDNLSEELIKYGTEFKNLSIYAPDKACISGIVAEWDKTKKNSSSFDCSTFWDEKEQKFLLGNFNNFTEYLKKVLGFKIENIPSEPKS
jgi:hypothetical protein